VASSRDLIRTEAREQGWERDTRVSMVSQNKYDIFRFDGNTLYVHYDSTGRVVAARTARFILDHQTRKGVLAALNVRKL
jgi:hypothetical protein